MEPVTLSTDICTTAQNPNSCLFTTDRKWIHQNWQQFAAGKHFQTLQVPEIESKTQITNQKTLPKLNWLEKFRNPNFNITVQNVWLTSPIDSTMPNNIFTTLQKQKENMTYFNKQLKLKKKKKELPKRTKIKTKRNETKRTITRLRRTYLEIRECLSDEKNGEIERFAKNNRNTIRTFYIIRDKQTNKEPTFFFLFLKINFFLWYGDVL